MISNIASTVFSRIFITDIPADDILELFGKTFFEFCQDSGYDKILQVLGATPRDFLQVGYGFEKKIHQLFLSNSSNKFQTHWAKY